MAMGAASIKNLGAPELVMLGQIITISIIFTRTGGTITIAYKT